jgi:GAF domain-containing protein
MNMLKIICRRVAAALKQALLLPRSLSIATRLRRRQVARNEFETERLDRIRNPSKYRGK